MPAHAFTATYVALPSCLLAMLQQRIWGPANLGNGVDLGVALHSPPGELLPSLPPCLSPHPSPQCLGLASSAVRGELILMLIAKLIVLIAKSII